MTDFSLLKGSDGLTVAASVNTVKYYDAIQRKSGLKTICRQL